MKATNYLTCLICAALLACAISCTDKPAEAEQVGASVPVSQNPEMLKLNKKIAESPNDAALYASRGTLWYSLENYDDGIADLEKAIGMDSLVPEYYHALADMYLDYLKSRQALNVMERAVSKFPKRVPTLLKLAEYQSILKMYTEALFTLERIRVIDPLNSEMFFSFGRVFKEMGKPDQAITAYQSAVENDPDNVDAWVILAGLLADKGSPVALKYYDNALRVDSTNIPALLDKAYYLSNKKNDLAGAMKIYKKINVINPQYEDGYYNAGLLYLEMDSLDKAWQSFDMAIKFSPSFAAAYYHRGVASQLKGDMAKAKTDFQNTLNFDPDYASAKSALQQMK